MVARHDAPVGGESALAAPMSESAMQDSAGAEMDGAEVGIVEV